jgi:subtilisin family serine protease
LAVVGALGVCLLLLPHPRAEAPELPKTPSNVILDKSECRFCLDRVEIVYSRNVTRDEAVAILSSTFLAGPLHNNPSVKLQPSVGIELGAQLDLRRVYTLRFPPRQSQQELQKVQDRLQRELTHAHLLGEANRPHVVRVARVPLARPPDDTWVDRIEDKRCGKQVYIERTGVRAAWRCGAMGRGVDVADIDWGFVDHDDLKDASGDPLKHAYDLGHASDLCNKTNELGGGNQSYHGLANSCLIAARTNGRAIQGVAPEAKVWPIRAGCDDSDSETPDSDGNRWATAIAEAIKARQEGRPLVILLEVQTYCGGNFENVPSVGDAIKKAIEKEITVVVSAGNGGRCADMDEDDPNLKIESTGSILVGATWFRKKEQVLADFSNWGERIVVSAPGEGDLTCGKGKNGEQCNDGPPNQAYTVDYGGTSGAAAIVAGVVALMLEKDHDLAPADIAAALKGRETPIAGANPAGVFLNAAAAIAAVDPNGCNEESPH